MLYKRGLGLRNAFEGIRIALREELNFKIEILIAMGVLGLAWLFRISSVEWTVLLFAIGFVVATELLNTALEELCDKFYADPDPHIAKIKDLAAAAVLAAACTVFLVGVVIFIPRILALL